MTRSLFFAFFLRLALGIGLVLLLRPWLEPLSWPLELLLVLGWASVSSWLLVRSIRESIGPLQTSAAILGSGRLNSKEGITTALGSQLVERIEDQRFSDFDGLARALSRTARQIDYALLSVAASRDELIAITDSLHDAVLAVDADNRILWANQPMGLLLGGTRLPTSGVRVGHALVETIRDPEILRCVDLAREQRIYAEARSTLLNPGRIVEVNASPMPSGGAVALLRDVTRFEQMERSQREFVANVSHELRTPLTSIVGYVETVLDHEVTLTSDSRSFLETILKNARRMNRLTEDLLTISKVESSEQRLQPLSLSPLSLIQDAVQVVSGMASGTPAAVRVQESVTEREVFADHDATVQVLANLIENAIKYGRSKPTESARVEVDARVVEDPRPAVEFTVRDFGVGIASEHTGRIFERFYRVDKARSLESGGTGLGLAIARYIVEQQGGHIGVSSELGRGSTFSFTLPLASLPEAASLVTALRSPTISPDVTSA